MIPEGMIQVHIGIYFGELVEDVAREAGIDTSREYYKLHTGYNSSQQCCYQITGYPIVKNCYIRIIEPKRLALENSHS